VTCTNCNTASATWSWTPSPGLTSATHTLAFRSLDLAGNPSTSTSRTVTVDTIAPTFDSVTSEGANTAVTATFSEPILCSSVHTNSDQFLVTVLGLPVQLTGATCSGPTSTTIKLTLASAPATGNPVIGQLNGTVTDPAGNSAPSTSHTTIAGG
jgi:hypothetical protein